MRLLTNIDLGFRLLIKKLVIIAACLVLCACFMATQRAPSEEVCWGESRIGFPCRLDTSVVRRIIGTSGRKNICDDPSFCDTSNDSSFYFVSRINDDQRSRDYCINKWNQKKEKQETDALNFVYVWYDYVDYAVLDSFTIWEKPQTDIVVTNRCYNIKEGVLFR